MFRKFKNREWVKVIKDRSATRGSGAKMGALGQVYYADDPLIMAKGWDSFNPNEVIFVPKGMNIGDDRIYYWQEDDLESINIGEAMAAAPLTTTSISSEIYCQCSPEVPTRESIALFQSFKVCSFCKKERL